MAFYHDTTVIYGARVVTDDPHKLNYHVLDLPAAEGVLSKFGVQNSLFGANDREQVYLYTVHHNLEIGDTFSTAVVHGPMMQLWQDRIVECAKTLGIEIEDTGWITIHEYR
jgi:hypothetical protein